MFVTWNERARPRATRSGVARCVMSSPAKRIAPASVESSPASWATSVVFPAPLGPMTACSSTGTIDSETSSVAVKPPKRLARPRVSSKASGMARFRPPPTAARAQEAALREKHDEHEEGAENRLPVLGDAGEHILEDEIDDGAGDAGDRAGDDEGRELVAECAKAQRQHAPLIRLDAADRHAEARADEPPAQEQRQHQTGEDE